MKNKYNYILFDWDGTLARTLDVWFEAYKEVASNLDIDLSKYSDKEIVEIFFGKQGDGYLEFGIKNVDTVYESVKKIVDKNVTNVPEYPNAKMLLDQLKEHGCKMALHTTSNRNLLYPAIKNLDLEKYFEIILTKDDVVNPKPDPEVIEKELEFLKANKEECLIIGDSDKDMLTGVNAGVKTVLYYPKENEKFYSKEFLLKNDPAYVINNLIDLLKVIN